MSLSNCEIDWNGCAARVIDLLMSKVKSADTNISCKAMAQLCKLMANKSLCDSLKSRVNQLLQSLNSKFQVAFNSHVSKYAEMLTLFESLGKTLITLVRNADLIEEANEDSLVDVYHNLITVQLDGRLNALQGGPGVIDAALLQLLMPTRPATPVIALVRLLKDGWTYSDRVEFDKLVLKVSIKTLRVAPSMVTSCYPNFYYLSNVTSHLSGTNLDVSEILMEVHKFIQLTFESDERRLAQIHPSFFCDQPVGTRMRTIQTLVEKLESLNGGQVDDQILLTYARQNSLDPVENLAEFREEQCKLIDSYLKGFEAE